MTKFATGGDANVLINGGSWPERLLQSYFSRYSIWGDGTNAWAEANFVGGQDYGGSSDLGGVDGADHDAVIQAVLTASTNGGIIFIKRATSNYVIGTCLDMIADQHIFSDGAILAPSADVNVIKMQRNRSSINGLRFLLPTSQTAAAILVKPDEWLYEGNKIADVHIEGQTDRTAKGIEFDFATTGAYNVKLDNFFIKNVLTGINFKSGGVYHLTASWFQGFIETPVNGVAWEKETNNCNFDVQIQGDNADFLYGFKNVRGGRNIFHDPMVWDNTTGSRMTLSEDAAENMITGSWLGNAFPYRFTDYGFRTQLDIPNWEDFETRFHEDFLGQQLNAQIWTLTVGGGGTGALRDGVSNGIYRLSTGAGAGDSATISWNNQRPYLLPQCFEGRFRVKVGSNDAAQDIRVGFWYDANNYAIFNFNFASSGFWKTVTNKAGSSDSRATDVYPSTTAYQDLGIKSVANKILFFIDGTEENCHDDTADLPIVGLQPHVYITNLAVAADRHIDVDSVKLREVKTEA